MESNLTEGELAEDDSLFAFSPYYDNINEVLNEQYALLQLGEWEYEELDLSCSSESSKGKLQSINPERGTELQCPSKLVIEGVSAILNDHVKKTLLHEHLSCQEQSEQLHYLSELDNSYEELEEIEEKEQESELHCAKFSTLEPRYFEIMPPSPAILSVPATTVLLHPLEECCKANKITDMNINYDKKIVEDLRNVNIVSNNAQHLKENEQLHSCEGKVYKMCEGNTMLPHELQQSNGKSMENDMEFTRCDCMSSNGISNNDQSSSVNSFSKHKSTFDSRKKKLVNKELHVSEERVKSNSKHVGCNKSHKKESNTSGEEDLEIRISKYTNDKPYVHVYDPEFRYMFEVPVAAIRHLPPARLNITRLVLCRNYRAPNMLHVNNDTAGFNNIHYNGLTMSNEGNNNSNNVNNALTASNSLQFGCQMGSSCKFVHADCDYSKLVRHSIHVNYIWRSPELCIYSRLPKGNIVKIFDLEHDKEVHELSSELLLQTNGSLSWTETSCPLHGCVDYEVSGMCTNGELCSYAHRLLIDPNSSTSFKRAPKKTKLLKVEEKSSRSFTAHDNTCCKSPASENEQNASFLEEATEHKKNKTTLEDLGVNTKPLELPTSSSEMFKWNTKLKLITSNSSEDKVTEKESVNPSYVFTIMETDKAKTVLHDMSSIGTLLLLPKNSTQAVVLGSIQRDDLEHITNAYNN